MSSTLLDGLISEIKKFLDPLRTVISNPATINRMLFEIGANSSNPGGDTLVNTLSSVVALGRQLDTLASQASPSFAGIASTLKAAKETFQSLEELRGSSAAETLGDFGRDLLDLLIVTYLAHWHQVIRELATVLTLIEPAEDQPVPTAIVDDGTVVRLPFRIDRLHLERLPELIRDPVGTLRSYYWNDLQTEADADAIADKLFVRIRNLLRELHVSCRYGIFSEDAPLFGEEAPLVDHALVIYSENQLAGADVDAGITLTLSPAEHGDLGLVVTPFGVIDEKFQSGLWEIDVQLGADIQAFAIGRNGPTLLLSPGSTEVDAKITASLAPPASGPAFLYGSATGSRIEFGGVELSAEVQLSESDQNGGISASISKSLIVIAPGDGDGFISSILPADGLQANFDLGIAWSNQNGLRFTGTAGLDATLPVGLSLGGVITIPSIHLGLQAGSDLAIEVSTMVGLSIGPVQALIDRLGVISSLTFPPQAGNLGFADLDFSFKPPSGVGLSVDAAGVSGGGFLAFDTAKHEYSGVLQLKFTDFALQAFGLITTQVAGGSGYSLIALIDANFPPIQLGWGFTLNGVGGLFAVHRTADTDALHAALKADKLSTFLFPKNAIQNAPQILAQLDALFPTAPGRFLFGPMALIGWGTPNVLTVALAVIVELPEPVRIILIARLALRLPSDSGSKTPVRINMDALGILDLSQDQLSLDATLYDSKIVGFTLSGDMALRANWSSQREFLLAIGGFHPQFTPPPGFPTLQRITIDMPSGSVSKLRLSAYLAVTSNTVQFGAALDVFIGVAGFGLAGHLSFDALLQISPFHFEADISASVALTAGGDNLMSVNLDACLSGPTPWNITGRFKVHIIFFDVSKSFSHTWGQDTPAQQIPAVNVLPLITAAFADARNWGTQLPENTARLVSLRAHDSSTVVAHPLAQLEVHESVAPLNLQIMRFGAAPLTGGDTFTITDFRLNGTAMLSQTTPVQDDFAPAQFFNLNNQEKLAGPSFEQHDAGLRLTSAMPKIGAPVTKSLSYETFYIDTPGQAPRPETSSATRVFSIGDLKNVLQIGSSGRAEIRSTGKLRFQAPGNPITVAPQKFTVASNSTLTSAGLAPAAGVTYSDARALVTKAALAAPAQRKQIQILAMHEMMVS